ncbi:WAP, Kazal, immunoglobulin, Kunitz and NTR domain-containing protein 2 [Tachyglossus aculeatus]|uniref:WAP, Kazal, immunoglobulin, Kunitz and NTR domain-containing protein 2 n=1 Tax=Tachyglossus aculeatus TaxID=9261 RepID=UPI0018F4D4DD|nr:WAP, Kazal, immunoglobulin, Kunitz and NTR domain-containing protein 2 [Tachyglossus aculeatus]
MLGLLVLLVWAPRRIQSLPLVRSSPMGICPNDVNPNLWVDAQSTCKRECVANRECETYEKCCPNVCGSKSCVAARYPDVQGKRGPVGRPEAATCDDFTCPQQGSECDIWDGQPVCRCRDRCERQPSFTCASDGLTYYNRCYMDAEACARGVTLTVVTCHYHLTWPSLSPSTGPFPPQPTARPTTAPARPTAPAGGGTAEAGAAGVLAPTLLSRPTLQAVRVGETVSFLCDVSGRPQPDITWEKQQAGWENVVMRPNHVRGNVAVTNIAQLVIYNAQPQDAGVYTCTARNGGGQLRADFPLTVLRAEPAGAELDPRRAGLPADGCLRAPDDQDCGGAELPAGWHYDAGAHDCFPAAPAACDRRRFASYEACVQACAGGDVCGFPALQGPCRAYSPRWAYSGRARRCRTFVYGGCGGNGNNFESREACEQVCPSSRGPRCQACRPRPKLVSSFCTSDFVLLGRVTELADEPGARRALVAVDQVLKDDKMGLRFLGREPLEVTLLQADRACPCPNVTAAAEAQLLLMGDVHGGMAVLQPDSFVGSASARRVRKLQDLLHKKTCQLLKEVLGTH